MGSVADSVVAKIRTIIDNTNFSARKNHAKVDSFDIFIINSYMRLILNISLFNKSFFFLNSVLFLIIVKLIIGIDSIGNSMLMLSDVFCHYCGIIEIKNLFYATKSI